MSKCWYCNEELTTANYCEDHMGICTKCYGSMFKVGNEFVKTLTDKISNLEAKLAQAKMNESFEKEKKENAFKFIEQLKQQLSKKEKEIERFKHTVDFYKSYYTSFQEKVIDELEKIKTEITPLFCIPGGIHSNLHNEVFKKIDNQINLLKEKYEKQS